MPLLAGVTSWAVNAQESIAFEYSRAGMNAQLAVEADRGLAILRKEFGGSVRRVHADGELADSGHCGQEAHVDEQQEVHAAGVDTGEDGGLAVATNGVHVATEQDRKSVV